MQLRAIPAATGLVLLGQARLVVEQMTAAPDAPRQVAKRPRPDFVKVYMHNGYLKSLKEVVHFYNTRDTLPRCKTGAPGEKVTCWPAPEYPATVNRKQLGNLGLSGEQEDQIVAFMKTLSDGFDPPRK
jgi:cytochrome c peroxidase